MAYRVRRFEVEVSSERVAEIRSVYYYQYHYKQPAALVGESEWSGGSGGLDSSSFEVSELLVASC